MDCNQLFGSNASEHDRPHELSASAKLAISVWKVPYTYMYLLRTALPDFIGSINLRNSSSQQKKKKIKKNFLRTATIAIEDLEIRAESTTILNNGNSHPDHPRAPRTTRAHSFPATLERPRQRATSIAHLAQCHSELHTPSQQAHPQPSHRWIDIYRPLYETNERLRVHFVFQSYRHQEALPKGHDFLGFWLRIPSGGPDAWILDWAAHEYALLPPVTKLVLRTPNQATCYCSLFVKDRIRVRDVAKLGRRCGWIGVIKNTGPSGVRWREPWLNAMLIALVMQSNEEIYSWRGWGRWRSRTQAAGS